MTVNNNNVASTMFAISFLVLIPSTLAFVNQNDCSSSSQTCGRRVMTMNVVADSPESSIESLQTIVSSLPSSDLPATVTADAVESSSSSVSAASAAAATSSSGGIPIVDDDLFKSLLLSSKDTSDTVLDQIKGSLSSQIVDPVTSEVTKNIDQVQLLAIDAATSVDKSVPPEVKELVKTSTNIAKETIDEYAPTALGTLKASAVIAKDVVVTNAPAVVESVKTNTPIVVDSIKDAAMNLENAKASGVFDSPENFLDYAGRAATSPETAETIQKAAGATKTAITVGATKAVEVATPLVESAKSGYLKPWLTQIILDQQAETATKVSLDLDYVVAKFIAALAGFCINILDFDYNGFFQLIHLEENWMFYLFGFTVVWGMQQREAGKQDAKNEIGGYFNYDKYDSSSSSSSSPFKRSSSSSNGNPLQKVQQARKELGIRKESRKTNRVKSLLRNSKD